LSIEQLVSPTPVSGGDWNGTNSTHPNSYFSFDEFAKTILSSSGWHIPTGSSSWPREAGGSSFASRPTAIDVASQQPSEPHITPVSLTPASHEPFEANDLVLQGVRLFFEFLYPVYPVLAKGRIDEILKDPTSVSPSEACLVWSICSMTLMQVERWPNLSLEQRISATRRFIRRCKEARLDMDFTETTNFYDVLCSLFMGMALFEVKCRKVREAITLSFPAGLQQAEHDMSLEYDERLRRKRAYALLFITERGACVLDIFPVSILQVPSLPHVSCAEEDPSIAAGLQGLYNLFSMLDFNFVRLWNDTSRFLSVDKGYPELCALQDQLRQPMDMTGIYDIQRADVLITQQWLRLIFWQAALRGGLISTAATHFAFTYDFPLEIAPSQCLLQSGSVISFQVHPPETPAVPETTDCFPDVVRLSLSSRKS
jgi:hypothetical protein